VADADFILSLRTDEIKSRYLSATSADIRAQPAWFESYASATDQAYFIIEYQDEPIGTIRLNDAQEGSFCWDSWIVKDGRPSQSAMESALIVYAYAVDHLGFEATHFAVRKAIEPVCKFHERFGATITMTTDVDNFYSLSHQVIEESRIRLSKLLPEGVQIEN
jgi:hypothetical protein